jgi:hypothetical protein
LRLSTYAVRRQLRWTKGGFARSFTSTWTLSTRRSNSVTMRPSRVGQWRSAIRLNAASLPQRAMRRELLEFARQCRQPSPLGSAPNSYLFLQGSTFTAKCPNKFKRSSATTLHWSSRCLDEAYLDVTDNLKGIPTAWETAKEIRARIYEETKLTASAGISCNKFLATLASDYRMPNGQFAIMPDQAEAFVATLLASCDDRHCSRRARMQNNLCAPRALQRRLSGSRGDRPVGTPRRFAGGIIRI